MDFFDQWNPIEMFKGIPKQFKDDPMSFFQPTLPGDDVSDKPFHRMMFPFMPGASNDPVGYLLDPTGNMNVPGRYDAQPGTQGDFNMANTMRDLLSFMS